MKTLGAFVRRDFLEQNRYGPFWIGRLGSLFLQVFSTFFTAQLFNGNPALTPYGGNYFAYALVGTLTLQLLVVTMAALPGAVYYAQTQGTLEPLLTSPTPIGAILVAASSFGILTELVGMVLFAGVAWVVDPGVFAQVHWGALGFLLAVHGLCGWGLGLGMASLALAYKVTTPLGSLVTALCSLGAGYFYPVALLPAPLATVVQFFPFTQGMVGLRSAMQGQFNLGASLVFAGFTLGVLLSAWWGFQKSLGLAYRDGTLTYQ